MVCQVPTGGAGRGLDRWGAAETKRGASARLRLAQLLGQDLPPLIFQPKEQIRLGMRSEFVGEFTEPCPVFFGEDLVQLALSVKGLAHWRI